MITITLQATGNALARLQLDEQALLAQGIKLLAADQQPADCLLLDEAIAGSQIAQQIKVFKAQQAECSVLVCVGDSIAMAIESLQAGANGLLRQTLTAEQFSAVLRLVNGGGLYLDPQVAQQLAMRQIKKLLQPFDALTSREFDVFCMLAEGLSLQQMAQQLAVSSKTISNAQTQLKAKLGLQGREQIVACAKKHGLIS